MTEAHLYLVAYDVASPQRWRRTVKAVKKLGRRAQLSVFVCRATPRRIRRLEQELKRILDASEDKLMIVDLGLPAGADVAARLNALNLPAALAGFGASIV